MSLVFYVTRMEGKSLWDDSVSIHVLVMGRNRELRTTGTSSAPGSHSRPYW